METVFKGIEKFFNLIFNSNPFLQPNLVRWAARIWSILPIFWAFAEAVDPHVDPDAAISFMEYLNLVLLYISVGGLIMAWVKERAGSLISLGSLAAFTVAFLAMGLDATILIFIVALGVPALLFYWAWKMEEKRLLKEQQE